MAVQTEGADTGAPFVGMGQAPGRDSLLAAARQEILRLKDINKRLAQQRESLMLWSHPVGAACPCVDRKPGVVASSPGACTSVQN